MMSPSLPCLGGRFALALISLFSAGALSADYEADFAARAALLIDQVADNYTPPGTPAYPGVAGGSVPDPGKYGWPKTVARLAKYGPADANANTWISNAATINTFHFYFPGLAKTLLAWPTAPQVADKLPTYLQRLIDSTHCSTKNYNIWTGEGTENHINMSRPAGYLLATLALAKGISPSGSEPTAATRQSQMKDWVMNWSKLTLAMGTGEWDSDQYVAYSVQGFAVLYDYAADPEVKDAARAVLDFYAATLALKYTQGQLAGGKQRGVANLNGVSATDYLCWLWFAETTAAPTWTGNEYLPALLVATSSYRPPALAVQLARRQLARGVEYRNSKPSYLMTRPSETREICYIGPRYTLASVFDPLGGWTNASWAVVTWKGVVQNSAGAAGALYGNGGQKSTSHARGRNPYDQFVQHRNVLIQMVRVPDNAGTIASTVASLVGDTAFNPLGWKTFFNNDFVLRFGFSHPENPVKDNARGDVTHANARRSSIYYTGNFTRTTSSNIVWLELDGTYVAIRSIRGAAPVTGTNLVYDAAGSTNQLAGLVTEFGTVEDYGSLAGFQAAILTNSALDLSQRDAAAPRVVYTAANGDVINATFSTSGSWVEPDFDWDYGVTEQRVGFNTPDWIQPTWPSGEGHGRVASWTVNGLPVDLTVPWPVHAGPNLYQNGGVLKLRDGTNQYTVDFSGSLPVFSYGPQDAVAAPSIEATLDSGDVVMTFSTEPGFIYRLQKSADLSPGSWKDVGGAFVFGDGTAKAIARPAPVTPGESAFYRVVAE